MKLGLISLGCDKNTVDSERMLAALVGHGARQTDDLSLADVILVNTCGFIDAAKRESIETILEAGRLKETGACRAVVAVGCLVERYRDELADSLPEVDLFLGLRDLDRLVPELQARGLISGTVGVHPGDRLPLRADRHVSYLKVSEGCDHGCAFCAIPLWRGKHRSFGLERLVAEAQQLEEQGTTELNLVAQDLAHYGRDRRDGTDIATLVEALLRETSIPWLRLLYIYSAGLRPPLIELMATEPRLLSYIDMPIQHASDTVLQRMRRPERQATVRELVGWLRDSIPDLTLRTTVLLGFPGESQREYQELLDFLEEVRFDRLGAFAFSPQAGTRAAALAPQFIPEPTGRERQEEVMELQRSISAERLEAEIGCHRVAIVDRSDVDAASAEIPEWVAAFRARGERLATGRLASQADDVDGLTYLKTVRHLRPGALVDVEVTGAGDFDLAARVHDIRRPSMTNPLGIRAAVADRPHGRRSLPLAGLGFESAWGR
jgi:ribosomal protein S12 methylthiotransferase